MIRTRALRAQLWRALALPLAALGLLAVILIVEVRELSALSGWVDHTDRALAQANEVGRDVSDRESALRGALLTGDPSMAAAYDAADTGLAADLEALQNLVADDPSQTRRVGGLRALAGEWSRLGRAALARRRALPAEAARGGAILARLRGDLALFDDQERRLLEERTSREQAWARLVTRGTVFLAIATGVSLGLFGRRQLREIADAYQTALVATRETTHLREEFLTVAAHELRTPITSLFLDLQMLERHSYGDTAVARGAARAVHHARRLIAMIEALLDASALAADSPIELRREPGELGALVRRALARAALEMDAIQDQVEVRAPLAIQGHWDAERLVHAVAALIANGAKFGEGKPVVVDVLAEGNEALVRVSDQGIGIPREDQKRIFGRFVRGVSPRGYGGLGLGLFAAQRIAELHGGRVDVQSAPGEGAIFTLRLPRTAAAA